MTINLAVLGRRLKEARMNCGISQEAAAQAIGVPRTAIVHIESGNRSISTLELADYWVQRAVQMIRRAKVAQVGVQLRGNVLAQGLGNPRLANAGFAREQHHLSFAALGRLPTVEQQRNLVLASNQRRQFPRMQRLEAALGRARADHTPGTYWLGEALEIMFAKVGEVE